MIKTPKAEKKLFKCEGWINPFIFGNIMVWSSRKQLQNHASDGVRF